MAEELAEKTAVTEQDSEQSEAAPEVDETSQTEVATAEDETQDESEDGEELSAEELEELRANEVAFSWHASEYVHHDKGASWYWALVGLLAIIMAVAVLLRYWLELAAFVVMGAAIVVSARRPPRTLLYELTTDGIKVDGKEFPFAGFRSFGVLSDVEWHTIDLEPTKRFSLRLAVLFDDDDFDTIVGHLELHLPRVDRDPDVIERISRILRF